MSEVVDPLKYKSYGVKKPFEEKQQKYIEKIEQNKRIYPTNKQGNIDEWSAMVR
jgi:disulfide oxidoreductase YuzD